MNKFNAPRRNTPKERRARRAERKRARTGLDSLHMSDKPHVTHTVSGKKLRKLQRKWRLAQKQVLESGLVSMEDIEMLSADKPSEDIAEGSAPKTQGRFRVKKHLKLKLKKKSKKGKAVGDVMME